MSRNEVAVAVYGWFMAYIGWTTKHDQLTRKPSQAGTSILMKLVFHISDRRIFDAYLFSSSNLHFEGVKRPYKFRVESTFCTMSLKIGDVDSF